MTQAAPQQATQVKLLVNTASEAVEVIRQRYGENARVLSVKQVEAQGLKRLVSKPRLEVIVEVFPIEERPEAVSPKVEESENAHKLDTEEKVQEDDRLAPCRPVSDLYAKASAAKASSSPDGDYFSQFGESEAQQPAVADPEPPDSEEESVPPLGSAANPVRRGTYDAVKRAISMLESVGFDRSLVERARGEIDFKDIGSLPTMGLYAKICDWLRTRFPDTKTETLGSRRAFVGCSGVGKTAALCKMLSADVFQRGLAPSVLKVDSELPNPSDALEVFCDIMGAKLARSTEELGEVTEAAPLLVDMPGFSLGDPATLKSCRETLDELGVEERILVINAAYEAELIAEMMAAGETVGARWVVFTHVEETRKAGKLWKFLLNGRIKPLFFSEGPNPAGEYTMETCSYLLERSFPGGRDLAAAQARQSGREASA